MSLLKYTIKELYCFRFRKKSHLFLVHVNVLETQMSPNHLWWNELWLSALSEAQMFSELSPSPPPKPVFGSLWVLNQQVIRWGMETSVSENTLQLDNRKQMPIICQWLLENKTFYDIYFALAELLLMPKKYKLVKLPTAGFEMWGIMTWNFVLYLPILWPIPFFTR